MPIVTLTGDRAGLYVVEDEQPDGRLVLRPDLAATAGSDERAVTLEQFEVATGTRLLPPDGEG